MTTLHPAAMSRPAPAWPAHLAGAVGAAVLTLQFVGLTGDFWAQLFEELPFILFEYVTLVVGWLLAWRRPRVVLGWIVLGIPLLLGLFNVAVAVGFALLPFARGAAEWAFWVGGGDGSAGLSGDWILPIGLMFIQLPLRFPTGRLPSPRWRWFSWYSIIALPVASFIVSSGPTEYVKGVPNPAHIAFGAAAGPVGAACLLLGFAAPALVALSSLFVRYHRAGSTERAQLRWIFWAVTVAIGLLLITWLVSTLVGGGLWLSSSTGFVAAVGQIDQAVIGLGYMLIPISIYFAVSRHGLYSIDRIISRTAAYACVTLVVVGGYTAIVLTASALLPTLPSVGVAVATLAAAGAFLPLFRLVRAGVDRRFDRTRYDAERVVEAFGERLRTGADPNLAAAGIVDAVERTLQPTAVGIWLRAPGGR